ncbi:MAG: EamA/RhaT family transporter, partial [Limnohabitans sp.]
MQTSRLLALGAIVLWASLAMLGVRLAHLPPFWLTGVALLIGSVVALPLSRFDLSQFRVPAGTLALGV